MNIQRLDHKIANDLIPRLAGLLQDAVHSGGSLGFLPPLSDKEATEYWTGIATDLKTPYRILLIAWEDDQPVGSVQLDMSSRPNGSHRAEVCKVMVHTKYRGKGIAKALMDAIEKEAKLVGRTTLVLDTREGSDSEHLYTKLGYIRVGAIPEYARSADGSLHTTVYMYKLLK